MAHLLCGEVVYIHNDIKLNRTADISCVYSFLCIFVRIRTFDYRALMNCV